jgi:hypothetical protein
MARQVITAIRDRLNVITGISFRVEHGFDDGPIFPDPAIAGPSAVRSMRTSREAVADLREGVPSRCS